MLIKKASDKVVDVFIGVGWTGWSRFAVEFPHGKLHLKLTKGQPMKKEEFKQLYEEMSK
jgi:hypothetical protein